MGFFEELNYQVFNQQLPEGVSEDDMDMLIAYIQMGVLETGNRPTYSQALTFTGWKNKKLRAALKSECLKVRLRKRGVPWPDKWTEEIDRTTELTAQQVMVVQLVTDPTRPENLRKRLAIARINYTIYQNWMRNPKFAAAVRGVSERMIEDNISTVHTSLVKKAEQGDTGAMKLFYEVSGRHDPMKQQSLDLMTVVKLLLEVVTRNVTDPQVVGKIADGFESVIKGEIIAPPDELEAHIPGGVIEAAPATVEAETFKNPEIPVDYFEL